VLAAEKRPFCIDQAYGRKGSRLTRKLRGTAVFPVISLNIPPTAIKKDRPDGKLEELEPNR
jgi:hypothetical protein